MGLVKIKLVDAFETVDVELPDKLLAWFEVEARSKNVDLAALLSNKTSGLTAGQLDAVRKRDVDISSYVLQWIFNRDHSVSAGDIVTAPFEPAPLPEPPKRKPTKRWLFLRYIPEAAHTVLIGGALFRSVEGVWLDLTWCGNVIRITTRRDH